MIQNAWEVDLLLDYAEEWIKAISKDETSANSKDKRKKLYEHILEILKIEED
jgi:hypothetical protein